MPRTDTDRKSISVSKRSYDRIRTFSRKYKVSMSALVEAWIDQVAPSEVDPYDPYVSH